LAGNAAISGSNVVFFGTGAHSQGIYSARLGGPLTRIADSNTRRPSGLGYLCCYNSSPVHSAKPSISGNNVVFYVQSTDNVSGVYLSTGGTLSTVADTTTAIPGGVGKFGFFIGPTVFPEPLVSGSTVLFYGASSFNQPGMYVKTPQDPLKVVADVHTAIPGGSGNFTDFPEMSLSGDAVAFVGLGTDGQQGIYLALPSDPIRKVLDLIDMLDGKTITGFQLSRTGLDRDQNLLAFGASFSDGTQGLYTLNLFTGLRMNSVARTGPDLQLKFTSQPGHNYNVQAISDLANGTIRNVVANIPGAGLSTQFTISNAFLAPHEFYRIEQQ